MSLDLKFSLSSSEADLGFFKNAIFHIFSNYAPITKKYLPANEAPSNQANKDNYKIQHTLCKKLLRKIKNSYFGNLDTKKITNNRTFWKIVASLFTNKPSKSE